MIERKTALIAIGVSSLALIGSFLLLGDAFGTLGDGDPTFIEHYSSAERRAGDIAGGVALIIAATAFLVFVPALRKTFPRDCIALGVFSQAGSAFSAVLVVVGALFATTPLSMSFGGLFDDTGQFGGGHSAVLPQAATVLLLVGAYPIGALAIGSLAIASSGDVPLPRWHKGLGFVCAAFMPLAFFFIPILALPLWSCATAVALSRRAPSA